MSNAAAAAIPREPTEAMLRAADASFSESHGEPWMSDVWRAMYDAALRDSGRAEHSEVLEQAAEQRSWIAVAYRLPTVGGTYLVAGKHRGPVDALESDLATFFLFVDGHQWRPRHPPLSFDIEFWCDVMPNAATAMCRNASTVSAAQDTQAQAAEDTLRNLIFNHNDGCEAACLARGAECEPYRGRGKQCPDCPRDWKIDANASTVRDSVPERPAAQDVATTEREAPASAEPCDACESEEEEAFHFLWATYGAADPATLAPSAQRLRARLRAIVAHSVATAEERPTTIKGETNMIGPTYYVQHPDGSYSVADPQPTSNGPVANDGSHGKREYQHWKCTACATTWEGVNMPRYCPECSRLGYVTDYEDKDAQVAQRQTVVEALMARIKLLEDTLGDFANYDFRPQKSILVVESFQDRARVALLDAKMTRTYAETAIPAYARGKRAEVPREPTEAMLDAAYEAGLRGVDDTDDESAPDSARAIWKAMYDAWTAEHPAAASKP